MQYKLAALSLFAALAAAQNSTSSDLPSLVAQLPKCALPCFQSAASSAKCSTTDFTCLCSASNRQTFTSAAGICLITGNGGCSSDDTQKVQSLAGQICAKVADSPTTSEIAKASSLVTAAVGSPTSSSSSAGAAPVQTACVGMLGAAALAALAL